MRQAKKKERRSQVSTLKNTFWISRCPVPIAADPRSRSDKKRICQQPIGHRRHDYLPHMCRRPTDVADNTTTTTTFSVRSSHTLSSATAHVAHGADDDPGTHVTRSDDAAVQALVRSCTGAGGDTLLLVLAPHILAVTALDVREIAAGLQAPSFIIRRSVAVLAAAACRSTSIRKTEAGLDPRYRTTAPPPWLWQTPRARRPWPSVQAARRLPWRCRARARQQAGERPRRDPEELEGGRCPDGRGRIWSPPSAS